MEPSVPRCIVWVMHRACQTFAGTLLRKLHSSQPFSRSTKPGSCEVCAYESGHVGQNVDSCRRRVPAFRRDWQARVHHRTCAFLGRSFGLPATYLTLRPRHLPEKRLQTNLQLLDAGVPSVLGQEARTNARNRGSHPPQAYEDANSGEPFEAILTGFAEGIERRGLEPYTEVFHLYTPQLDFALWLISVAKEIQGRWDQN